MSEDPFARFESSRSGWLIPIGLFIIGAIGTTVAIHAVHDTPVRPKPDRQQPASVTESPEIGLNDEAFQEQPAS